MAQDDKKDNNNKSPRELFRERTAPAPYQPDDADFAWLESMTAAAPDVRAGEGFIAAAEGATWRLERLLDMGLDVDAEGQEALPRPMMSMLHIAVEKGQTAAAALLLSRGADADLPDESTDLPLVKAVKRGNVQMACLLLHYNADPDATDEDGASARKLAQLNPVIKTLMAETALPRRRDGTGGPAR